MKPQNDRSAPTAKAHHACPPSTASTNQNAKQPSRAPVVAAKPAALTAATHLASSTTFSDDPPTTGTARTQHAEDKTHSLSTRRPRQPAEHHRTRVVVSPSFVRTARQRRSRKTIIQHPQQSQQSERMTLGRCSRLCSSSHRKLYCQHTTRAHLRRPSPTITHPALSQTFSHDAPTIGTARKQHAEDKTYQLSARRPRQPAEHRRSRVVVWPSFRPERPPTTKPRNGRSAITAKSTVRANYLGMLAGFFSSYHRK
jgi:hypothetical protein